MSIGDSMCSQKGRKSRANLMCRVNSDTMSQIKQLSEDCGMSRGEVIDHIVKWYVESCKKE